MDRIKIHPLILLGLFINSIAIGMFAFENYKENNIVFAVTFTIISLFFIVLIIYGLMRNSKINRTDKLKNG